MTHERAERFKAGRLNVISECCQKQYCCILTIRADKQSVAATVEATQQLRFKCLPHIPYSLDQACCDYNFFGLLWLTG